MKEAVFGFLKGLGLVLLGAALIYVVWQPVLPSRWIVQRMAKAAQLPDLALGEDRVIRFDLSGKGGGVYNLVLQKEGVYVVEGKSTDRVDLVIYMEARDFSSLMISLARGNVDDLAFRRLVIAKIMRFGGDMEVFRLLSPKGK